MTRSLPPLTVCECSRPRPDKALVARSWRAPAGWMTVSCWSSTCSGARCACCARVQMDKAQRSSSGTATMLLARRWRLAPTSSGGMMVRNKRVGRSCSSGDIPKPTNALPHGSTCCGLWATPADLARFAIRSRTHFPRGIGPARPEKTLCRNRAVVGVPEPDGFSAPLTSEHPGTCPQSREPA